MALSDDDVALIVASVPEPIGDDAATWVSDLCFAIEAEVQAQDEALIRQLVEALENSSDMVFKDTAKAVLREAAITAAVGAAPPKDSAEFALAALVAAGHVSQSKVDEARALMPEGGDVPKTALEGWQPIETAPVATRLMFWWRPIKPNPYAECCVIGNLCYQYETGQRNGKWWNDALGGEQDIWHLTHWMPIPPSPKPYPTDSAHP